MHTFIMKELYDNKEASGHVFKICRTISTNSPPHFKIEVLPPDSTSSRKSVWLDFEGEDCIPKAKVLAEFILHMCDQKLELPDA